ncbi:carbonic anhydrase family protein [Cupriavidus basilensis]
MKREATGTAAQVIGVSYAPANADVVNNGHTIQVEPANGGTLTIDGVEYKLAQFHFHTPSEEKIDGKSYPLVAHLVHKSAEGKLAGDRRAVPHGQGQYNAETGVRQPASEGRVTSTSLDGTINVGDLLPAKRDNYTFIGLADHAALQRRCAMGGDEDTGVDLVRAARGIQGSCTR